MAIPTSPQFMLHDIFMFHACLLLQTASSRLHLVSHTTVIEMQGQGYKSKNCIVY